MPSSMPSARILGVGDKQVVANQLDCAAEFLRQQFPAFAVVFVHAVFNGNDGVAGGQVGQVVGEFRAAQGFAFGGEVVFSVFVKFAGGAV